MAGVHSQSSGEGEGGAPHADELGAVAGGQGLPAGGPQEQRRRTTFAQKVG